MSIKRKQVQVGQIVVHAPHETQSEEYLFQISSFAELISLPVVLYSGRSLFDLIKSSSVSFCFDKIESMKLLSFTKSTPEIFVINSSPLSVTVLKIIELSIRAIARSAVLVANGLIS